MKVKVDAGKITVGRHELRDKVRNLEDGYYNVTVEEWKDSRSSQQNRLYWKWMTIMGEHHGYEKNEMHKEMLDLFAPIYTGVDLQTGKPKQRRVTTSEMDVHQMHDYMEQIDRFASQNDVILPQPDDKLIESIVSEFDAVEQ